MNRLRQIAVAVSVPSIVSNVIIALHDAALGVSGIHRDNRRIGTGVVGLRRPEDIGLSSGTGIKRRSMGVGPQIYDQACKAAATAVATKSRHFSGWAAADGNSMVKTP